MHKFAVAIATLTGNHWRHRRLRLRRTDDGGLAWPCPCDC